MRFPGASAALARFTVLDLTRVRAGPTAVRQLADWGANVVKIEAPAELETDEPAGGPRDNPDLTKVHAFLASAGLGARALVTRLTWSGRTINDPSSPVPRIIMLPAEGETRSRTKLPSVTRRSAVSARTVIGVKSSAPA